MNGCTLEEKWTARPLTPLPAPPPLLPSPSPPYRQMQASLEAFTREIASLRTGRAAPGLLDSVIVDVNVRVRPLYYIDSPSVHCGLGSSLFPLPAAPRPACSISDALERTSDRQLLPLSPCPPSLVFWPSDRATASR